MKPVKTRIQPLYRVYVRDRGKVKERWGVIGDDGKLYIVQKRFFGWKIVDGPYIVKEEHIYLEEERGRKKYLVLSVWVDPVEKKSLPYPGSDADPWRPEEIDVATKVISNALIMKQFEEERKKIMQLMGRLQLVMLLMFAGVLIFAGVLYWYNTQQLMESIKQIVQQVFPSPIGGG